MVESIDGFAIEAATTAKGDEDDSEGDVIAQAEAVVASVDAAAEAQKGGRAATEIVTGKMSMSTAEAQRDFRRRDVERLTTSVEGEIQRIIQQAQRLRLELVTNKVTEWELENPVAARDAVYDTLNKDDAWAMVDSLRLKLVGALRVECSRLKRGFAGLGITEVPTDLADFLAVQQGGAVVEDPRDLYELAVAAYGLAAQLTNAKLAVKRQAMQSSGTGARDDAARRARQLRNSTSGPARGSSQGSGPSYGGGHSKKAAK